MAAEHQLYASVRLDVRRTKSIKYQGKSSATRRAFGDQEPAGLASSVLRGASTSCSAGSAGEGDVLDVGLNWAWSTRRDPTITSRKRTSRRDEECQGVPAGAWWSSPDKIETLIREKLVNLDDIPLEMSTSDEEDDNYVDDEA